MLVLARAEGVVGALHQALSTGDANDARLAQALLEEARVAAARNLLCVAEARRVQQALDAAGIPAIWLKGIALGQWLYPRPHLRDVADIDLLLPDHATTLRAAEVLAPLGYTLPNPHIAGNLVVHELLAWSERARLELDLHWDLSNGALFAGRLPWQVLAAEAIPLPGLGAGARGLSPRHALLHACLHRAVNMLTGQQDRLRWLQDIHLLACALDEADWAGLVEAATAAGLGDATLAGLQAVQRVFGTALPHEVGQALEQAASRESIRTQRLADWGYFQRSCWHRLPGLRTRLRWLRQLAVPDLAHMRVRYGADGAGAARLVIRRLRDGWRRWRGYARHR
jgi:hypothetical protein